MGKAPCTNSPSTLEPLCCSAQLGSEIKVWSLTLKLGINNIGIRHEGHPGYNVSDCSKKSGTQIGDLIHLSQHLLPPPDQGNQRA